MKPSCVTIQMKAIEQYFQVVLFIILYKVILTSKNLSVWIKLYYMTTQLKAFG